MNDTATNKANMKIVFANKFFFHGGGSESVFFQEIEYLRQKGFDVVEFSMHDPRNVHSDFARYFVSNVDYNSYSGLLGGLKTAVSFVHSREAVRKITDLVEKERPHIAHLHNIYHQITPAIIPVLKKMGVKVIVTLHDGKLVCPAYLMLNRGRICEMCQGRHFYKALWSNCQESLFRGFMLAVEGYWHKWRRSYEGVDLFITPSRFLANFVEKYRIPSGKIAVLPNGIDVDRFIPINADGGYVLYFGRLSREKGVETLLKAHALLEPEIPLKIVGTGPIEGELRSRYSGPEFVGYKTGGELMTLIRNASFVVVPSEWYENCSMAILEAMAYGKAVIGSEIGGIPEQIEDGVTGLLFEMGEIAQLASKISYLWNHPGIREKMGKASRDRVNKYYSLEQHGRGLMDLYETVLKK